MKIFKFLFCLLCLVVIVLAVLFFLAFQKHDKYSSDVRLKRQQVAEAASYKQEAMQLSRTLEEIRRDSGLLSKKIPFHETQPLATIKELTVLARQRRLVNVSFICPDRTASGQSQITSSPAVAAGSPFAAPASPSAASGEINPLEFSMTCECDFRQLLGFLEDISSLERLVSVRSIRVSRNQTIIPKQKVTFELTSYTFP